MWYRVVSIQSSLMLIGMRKAAAGCLGHMGYCTVTVYGGYDKPSWNGIISYKICFCGSCGQKNASRMRGPGSRPLKVCTLCSSSTKNRSDYLAHTPFVFISSIICDFSPPGHVERQ